MWLRLNERQCGSFDELGALGGARYCGVELSPGTAPLDQLNHSGHLLTNLQTHAMCTHLTPDWHDLGATAYPQLDQGMTVATHTYIPLLDCETKAFAQGTRLLGKWTQ